MALNRQGLSLFHDLAVSAIKDGICLILKLSFCFWIALMLADAELVVNSLLL